MEGNASNQDFISSGDSIMSHHRDTRDKNQISKNRKAYRQEILQKRIERKLKQELHSESSTFRHTMENAILSKVQNDLGMRNSSISTLPMLELPKHLLLKMKNDPSSSNQSKRNKGNRTIRQLCGVKQYPKRISMTSTKTVKFILPPRSLRQTSVLILCTDFSNKSSTRHVLDAARTLSAYNYNVTIITTNSGKREKLLRNVVVKEVGRFIPEDFLGAYRSFFYALRSAYLAFRVLRTSFPREPVMILCESSPIVLPILYSTGIKTAYFQFLFNMLESNPKMSEARINTGLVPKLCLPYANYILLPNKSFKFIYRNSFRNLKSKLYVLYPFLHNKKSNNKQDISFESYSLPNTCYKSESIIFLTLGEYDERSNFDLAIQSFEYLLSLTDDRVKSNLFLILSGHCYKNSCEHLKYYEKIYNMVQKTRRPDQIILLKHLSMKQKKHIINMSSVLLHTTLDEIFSTRVLEAMSLAKSVIASNTGTETI